MLIPHPTNDPSLVSYHRPELSGILDQLELAYDCWSLMSNGPGHQTKQKYLYRDPGENPKAYESRVKRSTYAPIYRDSIKAYAGLLGRFKLIDAPPSLLENVQNVDLAGSSVQNFWTACDERALRDGGVFILVDMPKQLQDNFYDQNNNNNRPYMMMIERKDVINWSCRYENGKEYIDHVTVRQLRAKREEFGTKVEPVYYHMTPGKLDIYSMEKRDGKWVNKKEGRTISTTLSVIPIVWYSSTTSKFAQGDLPMNGLAELSVQHYQMRSDLTELLRKCSLPVPVRKGAALNARGSYDPILIGSNTAIDIPSDGDFYFAEPSGQSLQRHQAEIEHIEELMDRSGLNFLYGANIKTATEASLRATQVASQVSALIRNKVSAFNNIMRVWAFYAGELSSITRESGMSLNDSLINRPLDPSGIAQLVNLKEHRLFSRVGVLTELQRGGVVDPDLDVEAELARIKEDEQEDKDGQGDGQSSGNAGPGVKSEPESEENEGTLEKSR